MPRRSSIRLTDRAIRALPKPERGARIVYDADLSGFGLRTTPTGAKAFVLNYVVNRRERRMTIGQFPTWSSSAAREQARSLKRKIAIGIDPLAQAIDVRAQRDAAESAPNVQDLFDRYASEHLPTKSQRAASDDRSMWRNYILPALGKRSVASLVPADVDALHREIGATKPIRANRVVEVLRKAINLAIRWGWRQDNPASGARRNPEQPRNQFLTPAEILRLSKAIDAHKERTSADAIKLLMLTGARRSEVLSARWDEFDLENGVWVKPSAHTKQRRDHRVPLSDAAVRLLLDRSGQRASEFVFPSDTRDQPITDVKRSWLAICRAAELADLGEQRLRNGAVVLDRDGNPELVWKPRFRLHDLRHTFASVLASEGLSLPIIGALLGHTQPQTTARYAHLLDNPLRDATERASAVLTST